MRFSAQYDTNSDTAYWGIREIAFVAVKCVSCPSDAIINAAATTGIIIGVLIGLLVLLIIPIIVLERLYITEILEKKRNIRAKLADTRTRRNR